MTTNIIALRHEVELLVPATVTVKTDFRVPRAAMRRSFDGRLMVVEGSVVCDLRPALDGEGEHYTGGARYIAQIRGWHRGAALFAGQSPTQAVLRALGLERCPDRD